jgi:hypothetical protein
MIQEPIISVPVLSSGIEKRKYFLTALSLKTLSVILSPVLQHKTQGAGLRSDNLAARKIAEEWRKRGTIECIKPIVIAIANHCRFVPSLESQNTGAGNLEFTFSDILDVCDGIQRLTAIQTARPTNDEMRMNEWPVQFVVVSDQVDLARVNEMIRKQTAPLLGRRQSLRNDHAFGKWIESVIEKSLLLHRAVVLSKSSLAPRSSHVWAGSAVRKAFNEILASNILPPTQEAATNYAKIWDQIPTFIHPLQSYQEDRMPASKLREETVLTLAPTFKAIAIVAAVAITQSKDTPEKHLLNLLDIDWSIDRNKAKAGGREARKKDWTQRLLTACGLQQPSPYNHP